MNKYTPGPWEIDDQLPPNPRSVIARTVGRRAISGNTVGPHDSLDDDSNARLIAAAPDLLELLKEAQIRIFRLDGNSDLYRRICLVLCKAEGRQGE